MRKFKYVLVMVLALNSAPTIAEEQCTANDVNVTVNGLVCDFCARALEKVIGERDEVASIDVNLDNGNVKIVMKEGKSIDDAEITSLIKDSGYDVREIVKGC